jgi:hypothetical protein
MYVGITNNCVDLYRPNGSVLKCISEREVSPRTIVEVLCDKQADGVPQEGKVLRTRKDMIWEVRYKR